ncbi:MAG: hypothetical protein M3547_01125 [Acidobacteriota bacterium]|nr:hypothetical protein [Acidobacteriota bacterium]
MTRQGHYGAAVIERDRTLELLRTEIVRAERLESADARLAVINELQYLISRVRVRDLQRLVVRKGRWLLFSRAA